MYDLPLYSTVDTRKKALIGHPWAYTSISLIAALFNGMPSTPKPLTGADLCCHGRDMEMIRSCSHQSTNKCVFGIITKEDISGKRIIIKRSSLFFFLLLFPVLKLSALWSALKLQRKKPAIYRDNKNELKTINEWKLCCSRSVVLMGYK